MRFLLKTFTLVFVFVSIFGFSSALSLRASAASTPTFIFLRDLKEGDTGRDVLELQKLLNTDVSTQVSTAGAGSLGNETSYFGQATKAAVIRFQNKYSSEVLRPAAETTGSGLVGLWTRLKLNEILLKSSVAQMPANLPETETESNQPTSPPFFTTNPPETNFYSLPSSVRNLIGPGSQLDLFGNSNTLAVYFPSSYFGSVGTVLSLTGSGFSPNSNTISFGKNKIKNISAPNQNVLTFAVPQAISTGRYDVSVTAGGKTSNAIPFMVTIPGASRPVIEKIEPAQVEFDKEIKITGRNFTKKDNIVSSPAGIVRGITSVDGKTLKFKIPRPESLTKVSEDDAQFLRADITPWLVRLYIANENGISDPNEAAKLLINL